MRFTLEKREGYVVRACGSDVDPTRDELHIITMDNAFDVGLTFGDRVELEFPGGSYSAERIVPAVVVGTLAKVKGGEERWTGHPE